MLGRDNAVGDGVAGSITECISYLNKHFAGQEIEISVSEEIPHVGRFERLRIVPKYLFRGENGSRRATESAWHRLQPVSELDEHDRREIGSVATQIVNWLANQQNNFGIASHDAWGLIQHLGLPTDYIDFSSDPEVAAAFAVGGSSNRESIAKICVIETSRVKELGQIADFATHRWCDRARRQAAFGFAPIKFPNLKSSEFIDASGACWIDAKITAPDVDRFESRYRELLDLESDPVAGLIRSLVNKYVFETGELRPRVASWISRKIAMAPLVASVSGFQDIDGQQLPDGVEFLAPGKFLTWCSTREREWSLRYWSPDFADKVPPTDDFTKLADNIIAFPGTYHAACP